MRPGFSSMEGIQQQAIAIHDLVIGTARDSAEACGRTHQSFCDRNRHVVAESGDSFYVAIGPSLAKQ